MEGEQSIPGEPGFVRLACWVLLGAVLALALSAAGMALAMFLVMGSDIWALSDFGRFNAIFTPALVCSALFALGQIFWLMLRSRLARVVLVLLYAPLAVLIWVGFTGPYLFSLSVAELLIYLLGG
ncbi:hypothetical protein HNP46_002059 [Pseudomonas nitritireducens]|uniref:Uncharacterized protein n=1 Tax=Pseudomonas nitroreducens TaxID=46680 RepID=A0A7W7P1E1_PSENT|nr:hypothetical protein [Pseudomonas nitritireducens]MBB4863212.1 hypothetical protein [Pseudomonas nitritireducens]